MDLQFAIGSEEFLAKHRTQKRVAREDLIEDQEEFPLLSFLLCVFVPLWLILLIFLEMRQA